ncbi:MAG TPA: hypothetical protein VFF04_03800 [Candidatus Babeliales bacterium]|nr:hypothetical protein [Candidatus Babeliales bacterium]
MELELLQRQNKMLSYLSSLPRRMLLLHGTENVTEFVLHDLCQCFNFNKAAYFVDNPDFNCTKGVAGFSTEEPFASETIWADPVSFSTHMKQSQFNQRVRGLTRCSVKKDGDSNHAQLAELLAKDLGFNNYAFCSWAMRHENEGFVLYEKASIYDSFADEHLLDGLSLLSFCPIF